MHVSQTSKTVANCTAIRCNSRGAYREHVTGTVHTSLDYASNGGVRYQGGTLIAQTV